MARLTPIELRAEAVRRRWEKRLAARQREYARLARAEERERKALLRVYAKTGKAARRDVQKIIKRGALFTRQTSRKLFTAAPQIGRVQTRERIVKERRQPLTGREERLLPAAIGIALDSGKEIPAGIVGYLKTHPAKARDWIEFYVYNKGEEPRDISEDDIWEFFARYHQE